MVTLAQNILLSKLMQLSKSCFNAFLDAFLVLKLNAEKCAVHDKNNANKATKN